MLNFHCSDLSILISSLSIALLSRTVRLPIMRRESDKKVFLIIVRVREKLTSTLYFTPHIMLLFPALETVACMQGRDYTAGTAPEKFFFLDFPFGLFETEKKLCFNIFFDCCRVHKTAFATKMSLYTSSLFSYSQSCPSLCTRWLAQVLWPN